jgi:DNA processing protein
MQFTPNQLATLQLARTNGVGPVTFLSLLNRCTNAVDAVEILPDLCRQNRRKVLLSPTLTELEAELNAITKANGHIVCYGDDTYPEWLAATSSPPIALTVLGNPALLKTPQIAIVGNRNASAAGINFTKELAEEFTVAGFTITSGLARGIDTAAHTGALKLGSTIAVLAGGVDFIYPAENKELYQRIIAEGAVISEQPWGMQPTNRHFPRRNRIIAGLSLATLVPEASRHSGSLITAQNAGEYGRDVFAVPGSPQDPRAAGPNHLLKQGAAPLTEAADVLNVLTPQTVIKPMPSVVYTREQAELFAEPQENEIATETTFMDEEAEATPTLLTLISSTPVAVDTLIQQSGLGETEVLVELTSLELEGTIKRHSNGHISRV